MFEAFTLEKQRVLEGDRGWKPTFSALTYTTAECILIAPSIAPQFVDREVLVARRTSGAPDCMGKTQSKWGGYVRPTDPTSQHSMRRTLSELFGYEQDNIGLNPLGLIGPWLYKSTVRRSNNGDLILSISDEQAEMTPFQATMFAAYAPSRDVQGTFSKVTEGAEWVSIGDLISTEGSNENHLYWTMLFMYMISCIRPLTTADMTRFWQPGEYLLRNM